MWQWIASFDDDAAQAYAVKKIEEAYYKAEYDKSLKPSKKVEEIDFELTMHTAYLSLQNVRPAAITTKLRNRDVDAYDFVAHANPATTHTHYDCRKVKKASATE